MLLELKGSTGEELLLLSVLGGLGVRAAVDRELDHRALLGGQRERTPLRARVRKIAAPWRGPRRVA
jgi:hypothetical protein